MPPEVSDTCIRLFAECTFDGAIFHRNGIATDVNENYLCMSGYSRDEVIGKHVIELVIDTDRKGAAHQKFQEGDQGAFGSVMIRKDGVHVPVELRNSAAVHEEQKFGVTVVRDLSVQRNLEQRIRRTTEKAEATARLKDQFVALISHDLRSPLLSIKGILDIARDADSDGLLEMRDNDMFDRVSKSADGLIALIGRLLDHSRLQTGEIKPVLRFFNVRSNVDERIGRIAHLATVKKISITNLLPESMNIYADPDLFGEVIHNLISNAIKFTPSGGEVTIFPGTGGAIVVRDTGIGIDEHILPDLFNIDIRTSTYGTDGESGTGLGMPYSYNIMKAHGGDLIAISTPDMGTEFHVVLPQHTSIVLLVDDEDDHRLMIKEMITSLADVLVVEARNGAEALNMLRYFMPAIIITDIEMPVFDGFELVRWIRNLPEYELVPIMALVALAGSDSNAMRENLSSLGADDVISRPVNDSEFTPVVARYLGVA